MRILILIRYIAPEGPTSLARTTQASQLCAVGVLTSYRLLICAEFDQAQACICLRRNDSSAHHIAPLPQDVKCWWYCYQRETRQVLKACPYVCYPVFLILSMSSYGRPLSQVTPGLPQRGRRSRIIPIPPHPPSSPAYLSGRILRLDPSNSLKSCSDPASNPRPTVRGAARYH